MPRLILFYAQFGPTIKQSFFSKFADKNLSLLYLGLRGGKQ